MASLFHWLQHQSTDPSKEFTLLSPDGYRILRPQMQRLGKRIPGHSIVAVVGRLAQNISRQLAIYIHLKALSGAIGYDDQPVYSLLKSAVIRQGDHQGFSRLQIRVVFTRRIAACIKILPLVVQLVRKGLIEDAIPAQVVGFKNHPVFLYLKRYRAPSSLIRHIIHRQLLRILREAGFLMPGVDDLGNQSNGCYPDFNRDLSSYVSYALSMDEEMMEAAFGQYPLVMEKYRIMVETLTNLGYVF